ncbi:MAG TPA: EamA family transporter [Gaiellaceae bacterium]|nr:EamA family transporter [Gaiellaceae bacterium]
MPAEAFLLALGAAALHAGWNVLLARARDVRAATTVALVLSVILFAPAAAATWDVEAAAAPWIAASVVLELAYFLLLTAAYRASDVSLVYPIARGVAPVLVLLGSLLAGAALGTLEALGVLLVGTGVLLVRGVGNVADRRGAALGLAIAATIAGYTLVDNEGIEHASAIAYLELVLAPVALVLLAAYVATSRLDALRGETGPATVAAAVASFGAYAFVLAALSLASAASVAAVRETSVLFAVALGAAVLHERVSRRRAVGAAAVVAGVALVALA